MNVKKINQKKLIEIYSKALFASGAKQNNLEELNSDLNVLEDLYCNVLEFEMICTKKFLKYQQYKLMKLLLPYLEINKLLSNFLLALTSNFKLSLLLGIIERFRDYLSIYRREENIDIICYSELNEGEMKILSDKLNKLYKKTIKIKTIIDKGLLSGIIIKNGSKILDFSLKNKLERMRKITREKIANINMEC